MSESHASMETEPSVGAETPGLSKRTLAAIILTTVLLGLTGYLAVESLLGDGQPIGCGDVAGDAEEAADCSAVLNTKWSTVRGLPASGLAAVLYAGVLTLLAVRRRLGGALLGTAAVSIGCAGVWFSYLQYVELEAFCVYCTLSHLLGLVLAVVLISATRLAALWPAIVAGSIGISVLVALQITYEPPVFVDEDGGGTRAGQTLTLLDGRLTLNLDEEMIVGDLSQLDDPSEGGGNSGGRVMVKIADYNCPHCRHAHEVLHAMDDVAVVLVPMPLNPACNAYVNQLPRPQFLDSCELARLAIAIHRIDPGKLAEYDHWAYGDGWPNTAEAGRAFAETLVDPLQIQMQLNDPAIDAIIQRNTDAWGQARAVELVRGLPVHLVPGGGSTSGGIGDGTSLVQLLDGVHHSQQTPDESTAAP
ncbi:MAG: vitamin K epoxide reductase family protein [Planctomycetota bacterium]